MPELKIKRVYEHPDKSDGFRILVDRLWPRGIKKEMAQVDIWMKEVAPSTALRKWFNHDPAKWEAFIKKYMLELKGSESARELIDVIHKHPKVTLLYSAHDEQHNQAQVLYLFLKNKL